MTEDQIRQRAERTKYTAAVVLYGTVGLFLRYTGLPSEVVALCRGVIGAAFIFLYMYVRGMRLDRAAIRANRCWLLLSGVCLGLNWMFLFAAYTHTTIAIASLCNYLAPAIVVLVAPLVLREPLETRKLPCVLAALVGILLISGVFGGGGGEPVGILLGLASAASFVLIVICNRKLHGISALDKSVVQLSLSALTILPYAYFHNRGAALPLDTRSALIVLMLGVVHTGAAYCLYFSGLGTLPVQTVAVLGYLEPVVSVFCSAVFLHEAMSVPGWIGAILIIGAAVVSECIPGREEQT